jgi:glutamate-ammonia-ligase adenylyltransferase
VRLGFADPARAERLLADPAMAGLVDPLDDVFDEGIVRDLAETPDPDLALLGLVRLMESLRDMARRDPDDPVVQQADVSHLLQAVRVAGPVRERLLAVLGSSSALADHLARHPEHWTALVEELPADAEMLRASLLTAVGADPAALEPVAAQGGKVGHDRLRIAYRHQLLAVAGRDLAATAPTAVVDGVAQELADLAAAALEAGLAIARAELVLEPGQAPCRLAVVGMA